MDWMTAMAKQPGAMASVTRRRRDEGGKAFVIDHIKQAQARAPAVGFLVDSCIMVTRWMAQDPSDDDVISTFDNAMQEGNTQLQHSTSLADHPGLLLQSSHLRIFASSQLVNIWRQEQPHHAQLAQLTVNCGL